MSSSPLKICLFIPAYNVESTIGRVLAAIPTEAWNRLGQVMVIDNGSTDRTCEVVGEMIRKRDDDKLKLYRNQQNYYLGGSTILAFQKAIAANFDFLICMHSDGQADPVALLEFLDKCRGDLDFVFGSRLVAGSQITEYSFARTLGNKVFATLQKQITRANVQDIGAFIAFNLKSVAQLPYDQLPYDMGYQPLLVMVAFQRGFNRFIEFPISWGKVETSNVNLMGYGLRHLSRICQLWVGRMPSSGRTGRDFVTQDFKALSN